MDSTQQTARLAASPALVWTLTLVHHPKPSSIGRRLVLEDGLPVTLGRGLDVLDGQSDKRLSRAHAAVSVAGDRVTIRDTGSRNGTFVDGESVGEAELREGSIVGVGSSLLLLHRRPPFFDPPHNPRVAAVSAGMSDVLAEVARAASRVEPVLLFGETGVGKGLVAEELHLASGRGGPFVTVHCGAVGDERLHALLFGEGDSPGLLESADGGTLFLDGVDDARPALQAALLSFLERGEVRRVGAALGRVLDVQVVSSARGGVAELVGERRIRPDFAARIGAWPIELPPLRARREDICAIAARVFEGVEGRPWLHRDLALALLRYDWPGNVRELLSVLGRVPLEGAFELRLEPRVAAMLAGGVERPDELEHGYVVDRAGNWFEVPGRGRVSLEPRKQLERILRALANAHAREPGRALSVAELVAAGWPGEKVLPRAGASRVYVSIASLRRMGLRDALERTPEGYRLDARVRAE